MTEWQSIDTAPKDTPIIVWGYRIQGQAAPDGPYRYYWRTVGTLPMWGDCLDLMEPGCDCVKEHTMPHPLMWMPLPDPPQAASTDR